MSYAALMGAQVKRKEDPRLISGKGTYTTNLQLPGMHYVAFVRSPYAHARILGIDASAALERPGVIAVATGHDIVPHCGPMPMDTSGEGDSVNDTTHALPTHYALSVDVVRHVGEAVAAVIATSPVIAEDAAGDVFVDWEPLPVIADFMRAADDDAPLVFESRSSNVERVWRRNRGPVDEAFANAYRVIHQRMNNQRVAGVPMEGRAVVATPDPTTGGLRVWTSTQAPHSIRNALAKVLNMPESQLNVIAPDVGGGFGVKIGIYSEEVALSVLAQVYQMPLRWVETRIEGLQATTHGRGQFADIEAAVAEDGKITGLRMRITADIGAYPTAPDIPGLTGQMAVGVYAIPAVDLEITNVYTNTTPIAAYRGAGRPEAAYYIERMMNVIADELGIDPAELRRRNFIPPNVFPYRTPTGQVYDSGDYDLALTRALELSNYSELRAEQERRRAAGDSRMLGIGLSVYTEICGFGYESALVRVDPSGTVTVFTGISPHGQGSYTTFAQIVADQLGADFDKVVVRSGDTRDTPMGLGTMGSRGLAVGGAALVRAVTKVREKAKRIAGHILEAAPEDIELIEGRYQVRGVPGSGLGLSDIAGRAYSTNLPEDIDSGLEETDFFRLPKSTCPFGAHIAVVEVERETGVVHLRDYFSVDDCGPRISPMLVEGQIHGGLVQGISQALFEGVVYDENGQLLTGSLMDYALPRAEAFPQFTLDETVTPTPHNPLGVKGIGEAATIGSTPAMVSAVVDALSHQGVQHLDMPLMAERVWRAIEGLPAR